MINKLSLGFPETIDGPESPPLRQPSRLSSNKPPLITFESKLTDLQHDHHHNVLSTLHVHLDHDNCLEVLVVRGKAGVVRKLADALISTKGVKHGRLTITVAGGEL